MKTTPRFFICLFANEIFGVKITIFIKKYNFGHKLHRSSVFTSCKTRNMMPDILQKKTYKSPSILSANRKSRWRPCEKGLYRTLRHSPKELRVRPSSEIYGIKAIPY